MLRGINVKLPDDDIEMSKLVGVYTELFKMIVGVLTTCHTQCT